MLVVINESVFISFVVELDPDQVSTEYSTCPTCWSFFCKVRTNFQGEYEALVYSLDVIKSMITYIENTMN